MKVVEVTSIRKYKVGYEIRTEMVDGEFEDTDKLVEMKSAYNPTGDYIGRSRMAHFLCKKKGIAPEKSKPEHSVCSIGFAKNQNRWYGWSHRAICSFGIGDKIYDENYHDEKALFTLHGDIVIKDMKQAKQAAINFAVSVS